MKKILLVLFLLILTNGVVLSQLLIRNDQSKGGKIINDKGTIRFKSTGSLIDLQDHIKGTVIYNAQNPQAEQIVPNIRYDNLIFDSKSWLKIDSFSNTQSATTRPLYITDSFIVKSGEHTKIRNNRVEIRPESNVRTNGSVQGRKFVALMNIMKPQTVYGEDKASFSLLRIENPHGVDIVGDITVTNVLEMRRGEIRNDRGNIKIGDSTLDRTFVELVPTEINPEENGMDTVDIHLSHPRINRWSGSEIKNRADFQEDATDLYYKGIGEMYTGGENPPSDKNLRHLIVENTDSLILTENMRAIDSIYVGTLIYTGDDTLSLASIKNPGFDTNNALAEVQGHFRRTGWRDGDTLTFNNLYTRLFFRTPVERNDLMTLVSTVFPRRYHDLLNADISKVKRLIALKAFNSGGQEYTNNIDAQYYYGWRYQGALDETFNLAFDRLRLLHHNGNGEWIPNVGSVVPPQVYGAHRWGYSYTTDIRMFGDYAIGSQDASYNLAFSGKTFLEGAYRYAAERMSNELQLNNYLPMPPPDIYPYNLDPNRVYNFRIDGQFPDSVVDWVVLEFRTDYAVPGSVKTLLLKTDGRLVDMWGNEQILFHSNLEFLEYDSVGNPIYDDVVDLEAQVYAIIRHRNHSAVVSDKPINFMIGKIEFVDFTLPRNVMGGLSSLKKIDNRDGDLYGMVAGDINKGLRPDGIINKSDYQELIDHMDIIASGSSSINTLDGYLLYDVNLSGTITLMDYNVIFNNRNRILLVP